MTYPSTCWPVVETAASAGATLVPVIKAAKLSRSIVEPSVSAPWREGWWWEKGDQCSEDGSGDASVLIILQHPTRNAAYGTCGTGGRTHKPVRRPTHALLAYPCYIAHCLCLYHTTQKPSFSLSTKPKTASALTSPHHVDPDRPDPPHGAFSYALGSRTSSFFDGVQSLLVFEALIKTDSSIEGAPQRSQPPNIHTDDTIGDP
jgi:hypothetical protein